MKNNKIGKLLIFSSLALFSLISCNPDGGGTTKNGYKVYDIENNSPKLLTYLPLKFYNNDIPYVNVATYLSTFFAYESGTTYKPFYKVEKNNDQYKFTNIWWNNKGFTNYATFNTTDNTISYYDYSAFVNTNIYDSNPVDPVGSYSSPYRFIPKSDPSYNIKKYTISVDLDDYFITSHSESDGLYLPLYTTKTLFTYNFPSFFFNGNAIYLDDDKNYNDDGSLIKTAYTRAVQSGLFTPSQTYLNYTYNQILLDFDLHYGMKSVSRINRKDGSSKTFTNFRNKITSKVNELKKLTTFDSALNSIYNSLDDGGHTFYSSKSYYNNTSPEYNSATELIHIANEYSKIKAARTPTPEEYPTHKIYTNSASAYTDAVEFITFDSFDKSFAKKLAEINSEIKNNKKITHIAIDLSMNGGGLVYVAEMLASWLTRGNSVCNSRCVINGEVIAESKINYVYDLNNNRIIDDGDYLPDHVTSIDFIISNASFSSANYLACQVNKYSTNGTTVRFRGTRTGGGTCCVDSSIMSPLGSSSGISTTLQLCKDNGTSLVDNDDGVEPTSGYEYTSASQYADHQSIADNIMN